MRTYDDYGLPIEAGTLVASCETGVRKTTIAGKVTKISPKGNITVEGNGAYVTSVLVIGVEHPDPEVLPRWSQFKTQFSVGAPKYPSKYPSLNWNVVVGKYRKDTEEYWKAVRKQWITKVEEYWNGNR